MTTADGVPLSGLWHSGPAGITVVVLHGFSHSVAHPTTARIIRLLASRASVLAIDFRGHGESAGLSSVGRDEVADVDAAVAEARRRRPADRVVTIGFSFGGAMALLNAADGHHRPDAVVAISPPSRWYIRDSAPMRRLHWLLEHPLGTVIGRRIGVRLGGAWEEVPASPVERIAAISVPLLLVYGTSDRYFAAQHRELLARAQPAAEVWTIAGMGHAESGMTPEVLLRIVDWLRSAV